PVLSALGAPRARRSPRRPARRERAPQLPPRPGVGRMKRIRRALPLIVAIVLLGLATVFALFAADVRAWQGTLTQSDLRFRGQRSHPGLWRSPAVLPTDPARAVLGLDDALSYRRAVALLLLRPIRSHTRGPGGH